MSQNSKAAEYIEHITGVVATFAPLERERVAMLPVYLARSYELHELELLGERVVSATPAGTSNAELTQRGKDYETLRAKLAREVVMILPGLQSFERRRLIEKRIPFIVPGRQMYLPMLASDFRERFAPPARTGVESVSWIAQLIVLRHLLFGDIHDRPLRSIAPILDCSPMAITQASDELEAFTICERVQQGRSKALAFPSEPAAVWRAALPRLRSPVKQHHLVRRMDVAGVDALRAGLTALAERTEMMPERLETLAMNRKHFRRDREAGRIETCPLDEDATAMVQAWAYSPRILAEGRSVDTLSLYLSLRDDPDDRVQHALEQIMGPWQ